MTYVPSSLGKINTLPVGSQLQPGTIRPDNLSIDLAGDGTASLHGIAVTPITPSIASSVTSVATGNFCAYPSLAVTNTNRIILVFDDTTGDGAAGGKLCVIYSDDDGATWSSRAYPFGTPASGYYNGAGTVVYTLAGRLIVSAVVMQTSSAPGSGTAWYCYSDDNGATWSTPTQFPQGFTAWNFPSGGGLVHSTGVILVAVYGEDSGDPADNLHNRSGAYRSTNNGTTWTFQRISSTDNNLNEASIIELPDGTLQAFIRYDSGTTSTTLYTATSADIGLTWTTPVTFSAFNVYPGFPGALRVAGSNTILIWYRRDTNEHSVWRYSTDLGSTWSGEQAYSSTTYAYGCFTGYGTNSVIGAVALEVSGSVANIDFVRVTAGQTVSITGVPLELTDGSTDLTDVTKITVTGATVGGTSAAATLTISGGGSGGLLAAVYYNPSGGVVNKTGTGTMTALNTTHLRATFTAPASGNVVVKVCAGRLIANNATGYIGALESSTTLGAAQVCNGSAPTHYTPQASFYLTGVSAGSHSYDLAVIDGNLITGTTYSYGYSTSNSTDGTSPAFIEVWAAP